MGTFAGRNLKADNFSVVFAVGVLMAVVAGMLVASVPHATASQAAACPPQSTVLNSLRATPDVPFDGVVALVGCLPPDETLSSVVIDWGDGQTSVGTATFVAEPGGTSKTAQIHGTHTYAIATCATEVGCPAGYLPTATVVTASDGASLTGGGYVVRVVTPTAAPGPGPGSQVPAAPLPVRVRVDCGLAFTARMTRSRGIAVAIRAAHGINVTLNAVLLNGRGHRLGVVQRGVRLHKGRARLMLDLPSKARSIRVKVSYAGSKRYKPATDVSVVKVTPRG